MIHISIYPHIRRAQQHNVQTDKSWSFLVHNQKPPIDKNEVVSMRFIGTTTNGQAKWLVTLAGGQHRTIWTNLEEKSKL